MKFKTIVFFLLIIQGVVFPVVGQNNDLTSATSKLFSDTSYWRSKALFGINGTQTSFVNWSAGGRNNFSMLGFIDASATFRKRNIKWNNDLKLALGGLKFLDKQGMNERMQKTDDRIDFASTLGYEFSNKWFYTLTSSFKTQSLDGYTYPNDSVIVSRFMAPGYFSSALGVEFAPKKSINIFASPIAMKFTFVNDRTLADKGSFGVDPAEYDGMGNLLLHGKRIRHEYGAFIKFRFNKEIFKNIEMKSRLELFSNYLVNPQNIDINAEVIYTFKVNKWFQSSIQWNLIYDDDIDIRSNDGSVGPRTQFKSVVGFGISHTVKSKYS